MVTFTKHGKTATAHNEAQVDMFRAAGWEESLNGDHLPDLDHMGIDELRQFAFENGIELDSRTSNPDTARRRITDALGGGD